MGGYFRNSNNGYYARIAYSNYGIYTNGSKNYFAGNVGIGTNSPDSKLEVNGSVFIPNGNSYWIGNNSDSGDRLRMHHNSGTSYIDFASGNLRFRSGTNTRFEVTNNSDGRISISGTQPTIEFNDSDNGKWWAHANNDTFYLLGPGSWSQKLRLGSTGDLSIAGSYFCNAMDLAERTPAEEPLEAAEVVSLSSENEGELRRSRAAYEKEVAGIVSTDPGIVLGQGIDEAKEDADTVKIDGVDLALVGRVPVKATTENGSIEVGDLLVSSSKPGYAMRGDPEVVSGSPGVVIGKAMESLESGEGKILVLIVR